MSELWSFHAEFKFQSVTTDLDSPLTSKDLPFLQRLPAADRMYLMYSNVSLSLTPLYGHSRPTPRMLTLYGHDKIDACVAGDKFEAQNTTYDIASSQLLDSFVTSRP